MIRRRTQGFTLLELLIAVAIIGVLAATSIGFWQDSVRTTREAELAGIVQGLVSAQMLRASAYDNFAECQDQPRNLSEVDKQVVTWPGTFDDCQLPGWTAPSATRGAYYCTVGPRSDVALICGGLADGDGDGVGTAYAVAVQQVSLASAEASPSLLDWLIPAALVLAHKTGEPGPA